MERKLHRIEGSPTVVGGVAAGLAEYFNIDVSIVRVIFVLGFFTPIPSGIAYLILWMVLPSKFVNANAAGLNTAESSISNLNPTPFSHMKNNTNRSQLGGIILVALGGIFLADEFIPWFDFDKLWPLALIAVGVYMLSKTKNNTPSDTNSDTTKDTTKDTTSTNASITDETDSYYKSEGQ